MNHPDWYDRWQAGLREGDSTPLEDDPEWWEAWQRAVAEAPSVAEGRGLSEKAARQPPVKEATG